MLPFFNEKYSKTQINIEINMRHIRFRNRVAIGTDWLCIFRNNACQVQSISTVLSFPSRPVPEAIINRNPWAVFPSTLILLLYLYTFTQMYIVLSYGNLTVTCHSVSIPYLFLNSMLF